MAFDQTLVKSQVTDEKLVMKRREQIVAAAIALFSEQGYYRTSIQDIARKAGVSIGLIYQYAQTKEDVLLLSLMSVLESYKQEIPLAVKAGDPPLDALWATLDTYCRIIDRRRSAAVLAYRSTKSLPEAQREIIKRLEIETNEFVAQRLRDCIAAGLFRDRKRRPRHLSARTLCPHLGAEALAPEPDGDDRRVHRRGLRFLRARHGDAEGARRLRAVPGRT